MTSIKKLQCFFLETISNLPTSLCQIITDYDNFKLYYLFFEDGSYSDYTYNPIIIHDNLVDSIKYSLEYGINLIKEVEIGVDFDDSSYYYKIVDNTLVRFRLSEERNRYRCMYSYCPPFTIQEFLTKKEIKDPIRLHMPILFPDSVLPSDLYPIEKWRKEMKEKELKKKKMSKI